ncbi:MAG: hypothetical protein K6G84_06295 [Lachnospiraceae bacterium]|nr:hypothetical protein [Lachnospiraceae bacterium]
MRFLGNLILIICGGLLSAIGWWFTGILWCIMVVGIPVGLQCFKLSSISLNPFGKQYFKIAKVALAPFGARVVRVHW